MPGRRMDLDDILLPKHRGSAKSDSSNFPVPLMVNLLAGDRSTGRRGTFSLALVGVFVVLWIAATFMIDYCFARQSDEED